MIQAYIGSQRGAAGVEFAMTLGLFTLTLPSVVELAVYTYDGMQVRNSAQMGVQAVWAACNQLPATDSCTTGLTKLTDAVTRTSLNNAVSVSSATEGYYCADSTGALANAVSGSPTGDFLTSTSLSSVVSTAPTTCPTGSLTKVPGDYVKVTVTYTYTPVFSRISVASLLGTTIQSTAWMRLL